MALTRANFNSVVRATKELQEDNGILDHGLIPNIINKTDPAIDCNKIYSHPIYTYDKYKLGDENGDDGVKLIGTKISKDQIKGILSSIEQYMTGLRQEGVYQDVSKYPKYIESPSDAVITVGNPIHKDDFSVVTQTIVDSTYGIGGTHRYGYGCRACHGACSGTCGTTCTYTDRIGTPLNYLHGVTCSVPNTIYSDNQYYIEGFVQFNFGAKGRRKGPYPYPFNSPFLLIHIDKVNLPLNFDGLTGQYYQDIFSREVEVQLEFRIVFNATVHYYDITREGADKYAPDRERDVIIHYDFESELVDSSFSSTGRYNVTDGLLPSIAAYTSDGLKSTMNLNLCHESPIDPSTTNVYKIDNYMKYYLPHKCSCSSYKIDGENTYKYNAYNYTNEVRYTGGILGKSAYNGNYICKLGSAKNSSSTIYIPLNQAIDSDMVNKFYLQYNDTISNTKLDISRLRIELNRLKINGRYIDLRVNHESPGTDICKYGDLINGSGIAWESRIDTDYYYRFYFNKCGFTGEWK